MYQRISKLFSSLGGESTIWRFEILKSLKNSKNEGLSPKDLAKIIERKVQLDHINKTDFTSKLKSINANMLNYHLRELLNQELIVISEKDSSKKIKKYIITSVGELFLEYITDFYYESSNLKEPGLFFSKEIRFENKTKELVNLQKKLIKLLIRKNYKRSPILSKHEDEISCIRMIKNYVSLNIEDLFKTQLIIELKSDVLIIEIIISLKFVKELNFDELNRKLEQIRKLKKTKQLFGLIFLNVIFDIRESLLIVNSNNDVLNSLFDIENWLIDNDMIGKLDKIIEEYYNEKPVNYIEIKGEKFE